MINPSCIIDHDPPERLRILRSLLQTGPLLWKDIQKLIVAIEVVGDMACYSLLYRHYKNSINHDPNIVYLVGLTAATYGRLNVIRWLRRKRYPVLGDDWISHHVITESIQHRSIVYYLLKHDTINGVAFKHIAYRGISLRASLKPSAVVQSLIVRAIIVAIIYSDRPSSLVKGLCSGYAKDMGMVAWGSIEPNPYRSPPLTGLYDGLERMVGDL